MLAQLTDSLTPVNLGVLCIGLSAIIWGLRNAVGFWHDLKDKPSGADAIAKALEMFATKAEVDRLSREVGKVDSDLQSLKKDITNNGEVRKNHILAVIDGVRKENSTQIESLHKRIDELPLKIKELLNL